MKKNILLTSAILFSLSLFGQEKKSSYESAFDLPGSRSEVYKTIGSTKLKVYIYEPKSHKANSNRPAIVFFFGGGWRGGTPKQFQEHCRYLASMGMVAMTADYRVFSRQGTKPFHCVRDGKSAIRWIRKNANRLGIDPDRIVSGGGSAGGHVAASTGTLPKHDEPGEDFNVSSIPNAMILYNPVLITAMAKGLKTFGGAQADKLKTRLGVEDPKTISPFHNIRKGLPPTLILHGTADTTVPYSNAKAYSEKAAKMGLQVELEDYENMPHGFFNLGRYDNQMFRKTVTRMHQFLKSIKYLKGVPKVKEHLNSLSK